MPRRGSRSGISDPTPDPHRSFTRHGLAAASLLAFLAAAAIGALSPSAAQEAQGEFAFAYPFLDPSVKPPPDDGTQRTLLGSNASFTRTQLFDLFNAYDWFPNDHPPMPEVVKHGRPPEVRACGMCHLPNGQGRPENATLAGLPAAYIVEQMAEFKSGHRRSSVPSAGPQIRMLATAMAATDEEVRSAAAYFSELTYRPWIRVVETETVPKTEVIFGSLWAPTPGPAMEPLGRRIVEIPEDLERTELRDPRSGFVAYVPMGSIERGEKLVTTGDDGKTLPCSSCHAPDLKGFETVPPIAGRSTSYIVRQLHDIQTGTRAGAGVDVMKQVVAKLTPDDMIAIAAYLASRAP
jgi:cytochrome c553